MKKLNKEPVADKYSTVMANYLASGQDKETATISTVTALILLNYSEEEIRKAINTVSPTEDDSKNTLNIFEAVVKDKRRIAFLKSLPWEEEEMKQAKQYRDDTEPDIDVSNINNINRAAVG